MQYKLIKSRLNVFFMDLREDRTQAPVRLSKIPVTAKTRIGFDDTEDFDYLNKFILKMKDAGCTKFIIHARKAILKGLTPKQNLNIPKLNYEMVYKIKKENPDLEIIINGGISKIEEVKNLTIFQLVQYKNSTINLKDIKILKISFFSA